jgi:hypothetical protein
MTAMEQLNEKQGTLQLGPYCGLGALSYHRQFVIDNTATSTPKLRFHSSSLTREFPKLFCFIANSNINVSRSRKIAVTMVPSILV